MATVKVYDLNRKGVGELELDDEVFGCTVNEGLLYDIVKAQLASRRSGSAKVRNRAEVRGSSRKIYRQKGTGNARHGGIRAPIFVGGGQAHGPQPRSYAYRPTRKMRLGALKSALSLKAKEGKLIIVDDFTMKEIKTKKVVDVFKKLKVDSAAIVVDHADNFELRMSIRNLQRHRFLPPEGANVYDLLRHEHLVLTRKGALDLQARCLNQAGLNQAGLKEPGSDDAEQAA